MTRGRPGASEDSIPFEELTDLMSNDPVPTVVAGEHNYGRCGPF